MRRLLLLFLLIVFSLKGIAQTVVELPSEFLRNNVTGKNNVPEDVQGSPYWDSEFIPGIVSVYSRESYSAKLRYNAFSDEIEMETNGGINALLKRDYIRARIGKEQYQIEKFKEKGRAKQGYFIALNEGPNRLLLRRTMDFHQGKKADSSYDEPLPPRFDKTEAYFISRESGLATRLRLRKKDILEVFDNDPNLEDYIKTNKLKLKSVSEIIQVMEFMNQKR